MIVFKLSTSLHCSSAAPRPTSRNCNFIIVDCLSRSSAMVAMILANLIWLLFITSTWAISSNSPVYIWPLPKEFSHGNESLPVDPSLTFKVLGSSSDSVILREALSRYKNLIFKGRSGFTRKQISGYGLTEVTVIVASPNETLHFGVDESYLLSVGKRDGLSIVGDATIEANTIYGAIRGLETFSQLCIFNYEAKAVEIQSVPWIIKDKPRFLFRGMLLDTSRHYLPVEVIKQVIESMSYAKLNVLHWHIVDEESFPLEVPSYPDLWKGSYTKSERYSIEDASEVVQYAKMRGINVMAEIDVPGHAESWGIGYPDLWPAGNCTEPLDVAKEFTFDVISGILADMRKIFPFELFHLGGDEVNTDCWNFAIHVRQWLVEQNMSARDAYKYFVLKAQEIAVRLNWVPVNWEEPFNAFGVNLNPQTVVHNWLKAGVCSEAVAKGFRCIYSNQGFWYLDHLDVHWEEVYSVDPLEGIENELQQKLLLGGEVCMWGETVDTSDVQQTIWPRAAAAAERLWSSSESMLTLGMNSTLLHRLEFFRCLLNSRGVAAAPVRNMNARKPPVGPGSCYTQ